MKLYPNARNSNVDKIKPKRTPTNRFPDMVSESLLVRLIHKIAIIPAVIEKFTFKRLASKLASTPTIVILIAVCNNLKKSTSLFSNRFILLEIMMNIR